MSASPKTRVSAGEGSANVKLDSWKSIAAYLSRDPRTVQIWEKTEGLPIHRLNHNSRPSVYAYTIELDAWLRERTVTQRAPADPIRKRMLPIHRQFVRLLRHFFAAVVCAAVVAAIITAIRHRSVQTKVPTPILAVLPVHAH